MPSTQFVLTATSHHSELSFQDFGCGFSKQLQRATNHNEVSRGSQTHTHIGVHQCKEFCDILRAKTGRHLKGVKRTRHVWACLLPCKQGHWKCEPSILPTNSNGRSRCRCVGMRSRRWYKQCVSAWSRWCNACVSAVPLQSG